MDFPDYGGGDRRRNMLDSSFKLEEFLKSYFVYILEQI